MKKKEFKSESKRLLDLMINSIYTNKEIFLRELISNASDALDKLYYRSLTDKDIKIKKQDLKIDLTYDEEKRIITISDNGCGMTKEELENNLGTIAKSGTLAFKELEANKNKKIDIIGQFGVGFYSAFMVSKKIVVDSKAVDGDEAYRWESEGASGYTIDSSDKNDNGTTITLYLKDDTEDEKYGTYDTKIVIPKVNDLFSPLLTVIPLQLISYEVAKIKGCSIDKPKNLAKSVTVE